MAFCLKYTGFGFLLINCLNIVSQMIVDKYTARLLGTQVVTLVLDPPTFLNDFFFFTLRLNFKASNLKFNWD